MNTETQAEALRLADALENGTYLLSVERDATHAELRRLHIVDQAFQQWIDKTEWVQKSAQSHELGMHLADVMKQRIDQLLNENKQLRADLEAIGAGGVGPLMAPVKQAQQVAAQKDAVFEASIDFIGTLTGMKPPPIETAPPEIFEPFRNFTERVCSIFFGAALTSRPLMKTSSQKHP